MFVFANFDQSKIELFFYLLEATILVESTFLDQLKINSIFLKAIETNYIVNW